MNELSNRAKAFQQNELDLDETMISNEVYEEEDYHTMNGRQDPSVKNWKYRKKSQSAKKSSNEDPLVPKKVTVSFTKIR